MCIGRTFKSRHESSQSWDESTAVSGGVGGFYFCSGCVFSDRKAVAGRPGDEAGYI
jgi:hypothetical protein